jgi:hypothetical protein
MASIYREIVVSRASAEPGWAEAARGLLIELYFSPR